MLQSQENVSLPGAISRLMTPRPICVAPDERLDIARALLLSRGVRHLPVVSQERLVGILSLGDLLADRDSGLSLGDIPVERAMTRAVVTIDGTASVRQAAAVLVSRSLSCLPVVDGDGDGERLVGIVTGTDFMRVAIDRLRRDGDPPSVRLMSFHPIATAQVDDRLDVAHSIMKASKVRHLPVLDGERVVGMLSVHDVLCAIGGPESAGPSAERLTRKHALRVGDVMSVPAVCGSPDDFAADAGAALVRRKLGALPIVRRGRLIGMLSVSDFFRYLLDCAPSSPAPAGGE